jgi:hypothetical protein
MNERISTFLAQLGADPALRGRFQQAAAAVMAAAGLNADDQAEVLRQLREGIPRGRIFAASLEESSPEESSPEVLEGRIFAPGEDVQDRIFAPETEPADWAGDPGSDSADDVSGAPAEDVSEEVYGDSADDSPDTPAGA